MPCYKQNAWRFRYHGKCPGCPTSFEWLPYRKKRIFCVIIVFRDDNYLYNHYDVILRIWAVLKAWKHVLFDVPFTFCCGYRRSVTEPLFAHNVMLCNGWLFNFWLLLEIFDVTTTVGGKTSDVGIEYKQNDRIGQFKYIWCSRRNVNWIKCFVFKVFQYIILDHQWRFKMQYDHQHFALLCLQISVELLSELS